MWRDNCKHVNHGISVNMIFKGRKIRAQKVVAQSQQYPLTGIEREVDIMTGVS